jgi:hypothetical protein
MLSSVLKLFLLKLFLLKLYVLDPSASPNELISVN